jgi:hypothetical protein
MHVNVKRLRVRIVGAAGQEHRARAIARAAVDDLHRALTRARLTQPHAVGRLIVPAIPMDVQRTPIGQAGRQVARAVHDAIVSPKGVSSCRR